MRLQYIRAFIVLLAGLIALIVNMCMGRQIIISLLIVLIVILIFYVIGTLVVEILQKGMDSSENADVDEQSVEEEEDTQDNLENRDDSSNVHFDDEDEEEM